MNLLIWLVVAIIVASILAGTLRRQREDTRLPTETTPPYRTRHSTLNRSEAAFFLEMHKRLPSGFYLFPKMRIIDFLDVSDNAEHNAWRNKIWAKHVDFLVCDQYFKPVLAIEINGRSHNDPGRIWRDVFVRKALETSQLPLEVVMVGSNFSRAASRITAKLCTTLQV